MNLYKKMLLALIVASCGYILAQNTTTEVPSSVTAVEQGEPVAAAPVQEAVDVKDMPKAEPEDDTENNDSEECENFLKMLEEETALQEPKV